MRNIELTLIETEEALSYIDPNLPFKDWSKVGRALYAEFADAARDIFEHWSSQGDTYNKKEFNSWWKNFRKTRKTSFGSFIYEATEAGWEPERKERSTEEKQLQQDEFAKRRKAAAKKRELAEQTQWSELEKEHCEFKGWPVQFAPTGYMREKQMTDLAKYADVRLGKDKYNRPFLAWPIHDELFNQGNFCGYEKIIDKRIQLGKKKLNKFSSDNARTDIGFITFGKECDHGPKRVFVVGGLADAYSAHLSSGEIIITPIGEGNIPNIIELLSKKHPDWEFIAAPDNDKTGLQMVERAGGFWTLPQAEGKDWSDVYITEGHQALQEQLLHVRGLKTIVSNSRYLSVKIREGLNMLKSGMGTGKSTAVQQFIRQHPHLKTLIVSHRRALAKSLKASINDENIQVEYYEDLTLKDPGNGVDVNLALREAHILVCSVDSLHRLAGSRWDVVFVDEVEQNLSQYYARTNRNGENCLSYLNFALTHSDYQIVADAHLGNLTKSFCNRIGLQSGVLHDNQYKTGRNEDGTAKQLFVYESKGHLTEMLMQQLMADGKRYIYANTKTEVKRIATALKQESERGNYAGNVLVVHADVAGNDDVATALQDINAVVPDLDVIIASPTLGTGFDIKANCHQFEKTIGFLSSRVGTSEEGHQGLNRARNVPEFHVYLDPTERSESTDADYIHSKLIDEVSADTMKVLAIDPSTGEYTSRNPVYEWLFCQVKAQENLSKNSYKARFLELAEHDGYEITHIAKNEMANKLGNVVREQANERTKREMLREIGNAPVHVGEAFKDMMTSGKNFTATEIAKSKTVYDLNLTDATEEELDTLFPIAKEVYSEFSLPGENIAFNEADAPIPFPSSLKEAITTTLTYKQNTNRYVSAISKLTWANVNAESAKALDTKDVQNEESRVSWRHLSVRRDHMLKLLRIAGIDEQLNYNGREWTVDELNNELGPWLKNKEAKERLFKYSGITVTPNTLSNPCRWLNGHLRSFGVPVVETGKRRVNGKPVSKYGIDKDKWEAVCSLVAMRTRGIEASLEDKGQNISIEVLTRGVENFIESINNGEFKSGYNVQFSKWDKQCGLTGQVDLRDKLTQTFAKIADRFDNPTTQFSDPAAPSVLYKTTGLNGSPVSPVGSSNGGLSVDLEGGEKDPHFTIHFTIPHDLSNDQLHEVSNVAELAVNKHNLCPERVVEFMEETGLASFLGNVDAWAGSIRDVLVGEGDNL